MFDHSVSFKGPQLNPIKVNPNFFQKHSKIAQVVEITAVVLGILALLIGVFLVIGTPLGVPMSMIIGGCLFASGGALFVGGTISMILHRSSRAKHLLNQAKLSLPILEQKELKSFDPSVLKESWCLHNVVVKQFRKLNLNIPENQRKILEQIEINPGTTLAEYAAMVSANYQECVKMLEYREELLEEETIYENTQFRAYLTYRNKVVTSIISNMVDGISKAGGVFSLKFSMLSSRMSSIHTTISVILGLGVVAAVMTVAAFIPGGIFAIPILLAVSMGLGLVVAGLSYLLRQMLSMTKFNRQQLSKDFIKTVDLNLFNQLISSQNLLFDILQGILKEEETFSLESQPWYRQILITKELEPFLEEELRKNNEKIQKQLEARNRDLKRLEKVCSKGFSNASQIYHSSDDDFDKMLTEGTKFAKLRRDTSHDLTKIYGPDNQEIDPEFLSPWMPKKEGTEEFDQRPSYLQLNSREHLLLEEDVDITLKELEIRSTALRQELHRIRLWRNPVMSRAGYIIYQDQHSEIQNKSIVDFYTRCQMEKRNICDLLKEINALQSRIIRLIIQEASDTEDSGS
ncbi:IncA protein [Chlamydia serpentis]|uniref:IncA protein n=1 Tax=Chlamydia serpentis TaxID=1967782 RepID=A0A2R8FA06_9CHLA|nr:hypothetical protein [Chlamydia serpentis]SPN73234.1 IncA protein [Chlamydia serpentis]